MLEQLDVQPGLRVLEIGAGTGYNAALVAELAGSEGQVTTVDIGADIVAGARRGLAAAGYDRVRVVHGDGEAATLRAHPMSGSSSPRARGTCHPRGASSSHRVGG
ncbi:methyltransferase domain-containing protein [Streptosporangium lutulentum]